MPDGPKAEHGFSALVEVRKGGEVHRLLFDTGVTPDRLVDNMHRLGRDPGDIEAIVCSHGHFDHTIGLAGLIGRLGRANLPVLHAPGVLDPAPDGHPGPRAAGAPDHQPPGAGGAGFSIIEQRQPSFLFDRSRADHRRGGPDHGFEQGIPGHQAWRGATGSRTR